ncbi:hypothetical protein Tco_0102836 [Tanacetum coccineum]
MSFNDNDVNEDDDGNGDDNAKGDSDVNRDDDNAGSRNDNGGDGDGDGDDDVGVMAMGMGMTLSIEKQVDATTKEIIIEEEFDYITCTPESYSQWLDANSDFVIEIIDCVAVECLYGEALDAIDEDMRRNNEGTVTPERLNTRHSKVSPSVKGRIGRKSKVTGKSDSHKSRWVPMSERVSNQPGDIVLSPQPVSQYNPVTGQVVKESDTAPVVIEKSIGKPAVVKENPDVVKEKPAVVKEKPAVVKEKPAVVKEKPAVVKDKRKTKKNSKELDNPKESDKAADVIETKDKINVKDDPAKVVKESVLAVTKNKPAEDGKNSAPDVVKERRKTMLLKYKPDNKAPSDDKNNVPTELHKDKVLDVVSKDKPKGNASSVVVSKDKRKENSEKEALFQKDKALNVVSKDKPKGNASSELPKKKDKADIPKDKHKVHSKVLVLRSKLEVKEKAYVCEDVKRKRILSKKDHSKKKPEADYDSSSDEKTSGEEKIIGIRLNMETLSPGLWIDANVVDCWGEILNYGDRFRKDGSLSRLFSERATLSMFDGTLSTYEDKWKSFAAKVSARFKDNVRGLSIIGLTLLRFKFATKILLHDINVHAQEMIRYAEEFDKIAGFEKMCKMVDALKNRKEREQN